MGNHAVLFLSSCSVIGAELELEVNFA
jgi:hypothetical protein